MQIKMDHTAKYSQSSNSQERDQVFMKLFCMILIINCILTGALSVTVYYWKYPISAGHDKPPIICLDCKGLLVHPIDDDYLLKDFERMENGTTCCAKDTSQMKHLVHQFLERNNRISKARERIFIPRCENDVSGKKSAGRVVGVDLSQTGINSKEKHIIRWLNMEKGSYQNPGVTFTDGQLEISMPGYYWFNSRVTFWDTNATLANDRFVFFHTIYRRSAEYPSREDWKLAEAGTTRCKLLSGYTNRSSFIGDIAYFKKGEKIIVKVSHQEMLSLAPSDSFLEVHLY